MSAIYQAWSCLPARFRSYTRYVSVFFKPSLGSSCLFITGVGNHLQWNDLSTHFTAPIYALLDDTIADNYLAISREIIDGLPFVPAVSFSKNHVTPLTTEELTTSSVLDASAECESFSNDYGEGEDYEHNIEDHCQAAELKRWREMLRRLMDQGSQHVHKMMAYEDIGQIRECYESIKKFVSYNSLYGSPLKQPQRKEIPVEAGHESEDIADVPVHQRKWKKERRESDLNEFKKYKATHTACGRRKPLPHDSAVYVKTYNTSGRDRIAKQQV